MSLEDELQQINGFGDKTAKQIIAIVEDRQTNETARENLQDAISYYEQENYSYAGKYLYRALEAL